MSNMDSTGTTNMPNLYLKYVRDEDDNFVIFNKNNHSVAHKDFKPFMGNLKSAGFLGINRINGKVVCGGRSESLNVDSIPENDTEFFTNFFKSDSNCYILGNSYVIFASNKPIDEFEGFHKIELMSDEASITDVVFL